MRDCTYSSSSLCWTRHCDEQTTKTDMQPLTKAGCLNHVLCVTVKDFQLESCSYRCTAEDYATYAHVSLRTTELLTGAVAAAADKPTRCLPPPYVSAELLSIHACPKRLLVTCYSDESMLHNCLFFSRNSGSPVKVATSPKNQTRKAADGARGRWQACYDLSGYVMERPTEHGLVCCRWCCNTAADGLLRARHAEQHHWQQQCLQQRLPCCKEFVRTLAVHCPQVAQHTCMQACVTI
jgi:hypothetical protein